MKIYSLCACGCGRLTFNRFVHNHHCRGRKRSKEEVDRIQRTKKLIREGKLFPKIKISVSCGCGCGGKTKPGNHFINGHWGRIRTFSEEHRRKISEAKKKENHWWPIWCKGKKLTEEHRKNLSLSHIGIKPSAETLVKRSLALSGSKHWNWKGGISWGVYCDAWSDKEFKESIRDRDNHHCRRCGKKEKKNKKLSIHHINYDKKDCRPLNLISLCQGCNSVANYNRGYWQEFYSKLVSITA